MLTTRRVPVARLTLVPLDRLASPRVDSVPSVEKPNLKRMSYADFLQGRIEVVHVFQSGDEYHAVVRLKSNDEILELSPTERRSLDLILNGRSRKEAAHELGLRPSALSSKLQSALKKARLDRVEGAVLVTAALERHTAPPEEEVANFIALSGRFDTEALGALTRAERDVALLIVEGCCNAEIAARRHGRSTRTVANQVAAIFRKLRVQSRLDLVRRLTRRGLREERREGLESQ
jgi:DNA-binding CsgD family transcriptional regulator